MGAKRCRIIGLVGLPGSGKTTVSRYLVSKKFTYITLSDFILAEVRKAGITDINREVLQTFGNRMREQYGPQILAQLAHKKIREENLQKVVIDGIRNVYEIAFLRVENNFTLIGMTSPPKMRYKRLIGRENRPFTGTYREFLEDEKREASLGSKETGLRVRDCLKQVDYEISNTRRVDDLKNAIDGLLFLIKKHG